MSSGCATERRIALTDPTNPTMFVAIDPAIQIAIAATTIDAFCGQVSVTEFLIAQVRIPTLDNFLSMLQC